MVEQYLLASCIVFSSCSAAHKSGWKSVGICPNGFCSFIIVDFLGKKLQKLGNKQSAKYIKNKIDYLVDYVHTKLLIILFCPL